MADESQNAIILKDFIPLISAIIGVIFLCVGWYITHWLNSLRDKHNKLREIRLQYLIEAYRNLADCLHREKLNSVQVEKLESAVRDIQLFGTEKQVSNIKNFSNEFANEGAASLDDVINDLRDELRQELDLVSISGNNIWLRINQTKSKTVIKKQ